MRVAMMVAVALVVALPQARADVRHRVHLELDPTPFALGGYGIQPGFRAKQLPNLRVGLGNFSLDVPDALAELGGNEGFHLRVRRSHALYLLWYPRPQANVSGLCFGGSLRYLRLRYTHDDAPGDRAHVGEVSVEGIVGYKWHPFDAGFYVQPWAALAATLGTRGERSVGGRTYDAMPVQLFATVNIGWELEL